MVRKDSVQLLLLAALVFAICSWAVLSFGKVDPITAVWPANAVVLAALLRSKADLRWRVVLLGASTLGMASAALMVGRDLLLVVGLSAANALEIGLAAWLLQDLAIPMSGIAAFARFQLRAVVIAPAVSTVVAAAVLKADGYNARLDGAAWWIAHALGMAVWAPFLLSLSRAPGGLKWDLKTAVHNLGAQALVAAVTFAVFAQSQVPGAYLVLPFALLAVFVNPNYGGAVAIGLISAISLTLTALGSGPAVMEHQHGVALSPSTMVQAFLAIMVLTVHPVAAMLRKLQEYAAELEDRRAEAEAQSAYKSRLLAQVTHEIRSPLSGVMILAALMRSGRTGRLSPRQRDVMASIAGASAEIESLSRDLTDVAAIQSGHAGIRLRRIGLAAALDDVVALAGTRIRSSGVAVALAQRLPADLAVTADPRRLRQILLNLIANAAKYGGDPPVVRLEIDAGPQTVRILVHDNGRGVPPEQRPQLFRPFSRLGADQERVDGVGLGLTIARELARLQGGGVGLEEELSMLGGACFWLELPRAPAAEAAPRGEAQIVPVRIAAA